MVTRKGVDIMDLNNIQNTIIKLKNKKKEIEIELEEIKITIKVLNNILNNKLDHEFIEKDIFIDMKISEAILEYLKIIEKPQTTAEITKALIYGGIHSNAKSFRDVVYIAAKRQKDIIRINNNWSLK